MPDDAFKPIEGDDKKVCAALKKRNKQEREGQRTLLTCMVAEPGAEYDTLAPRSRGMDELPDDTPEDIRAQGASSSAGSWRRRSTGTQQAARRRLVRGLRLAEARPRAGREPSTDGHHPTASED